MKKILFLTLCVLTLTIYSCHTTKEVQTTDQIVFEPLRIEMFPRAVAGYRQAYIQVPVLKNEEDYRVEIFVGKEEEVDCNDYFLMGSMTEETLQGWGYTYYNVVSDEQIAGTRMACPDQALSKKFIHLQPQMIRYNSKSPRVIYFPESLTVKYRIWDVTGEMIDAHMN